jgi:hypothetical protein
MKKMGKSRNEIRVARAGIGRKSPTNKAPFELLGTTALIDPVNKPMDSFHYGGELAVKVFSFENSRSVCLRHRGFDVECRMVIL